MTKKLYAISRCVSSIYISLFQLHWLQVLREMLQYS